MLLLLLTMSWLLSIIFVYLNHPLSFGLILLMQTIIVSLCAGTFNFDYWFSYILFLIMIGGMLVLFIYMTSIASNEKFKFSQILLIMSMIFMILFIFALLMDNFFYMKNTFTYNFDNQTMDNSLSVNKYLNFPNMMIMILMMLYLLITLIAIVKITQSKMGPLRPKI